MSVVKLSDVLFFRYTCLYEHCASTLLHMSDRCIDAICLPNMPPVNHRANDSLIMLIIL